MSEYITAKLTKDSGTYIIVGDRVVLEKKIKEEFSNIYEVLLYSEKSFDIDTVRAISKEHSNKATSKRVFIISFYSISVPAQNALLKLLEEPAKDTIFCLLTSDEQKLLPTIKSRSQIIHAKKTQEILSKKLQDLLALHPSLRLENSFYKKTVALKDDDDKVDREAISMLIEEALRYARSKQQEKTIQEQNEEAQIFKRILQLYSYAHQSGSSLKTIADYTFLTLPQYK